MRPIKLTISAFGPYAGEEVFDFEILGKKGIYLITGDTGAGKTTIFDGIVFALYDTASGNGREKSMLRSKYASPEVKTFVELEFVYNGELYKIKRNPEYERPSKRGTGMTKESANVELYLPSGIILTRKSEVAAAVNEILGIDRDQFMQIAMIAQGDFRRLIHADTTSRQEIFREIFETAGYNKLQDEIKKEFSEVNKQCEELRNSVNQYINGAVCSKEHPKYSEFEKLLDGQLLISEAINLIKEILSDDEKSFKNIEQQISKNDEKLDAINKKIGKVSEINKAKMQVNDLILKLQLETVNYDRAKENLTKENENESKINYLSERILLEKDKLPKYDEQSNLIRILNEKEKEFESASRTISVLENGNKILIKELEEDKAFMQSIKGARVEQNEALQLLESVTKRKDEITELLGKWDELTVAKHNIKTKEKEYLSLSEDYKIKKETYDQKLQLFLDEQAGVLGMLLLEGVPCPVCGSLEHPKIAMVAEGAPTSEELKNYQLSYEKAQKLWEKASEELSKLKAQNEERIIMFYNQAVEILGIDTKEDVLSLLKKAESLSEAQVLDAKNKCALAKKNVDKLEYLEKIIPEKEDKIKDYQLKISDSVNKKTALDAEINHLKISIDRASSELKYENKRAAELAIKKLIDEMEILKESLDKAIKYEEVLRNKVEGLKGQLTAVKAQLKGNDTTEKLDDLKNEKSIISNNNADLEFEKSKLDRSIDRNKQAILGAQSKSTTLNDLEEKWTWLSALDATLNGKMSGKEKVKLETFVQMQYFDRIISRANVRFMAMTGGQYELKRRVDNQSKSAQSGLELDVIDHYNGSERSVKSLSGGESFKASLALALGLSDEIQSSAGGIKLDTMFIDEGFGSLDEESLNQAINTLIELSEGDRLIGIISHVGELKTRIEKQIIVKKEISGGSSAKIIV